MMCISGRGRSLSGVWLFSVLHRSWGMVEAHMFLSVLLSLFVFLRLLLVLPMKSIFGVKASFLFAKFP